MMAMWDRRNTSIKLIRWLFVLVICLFVLQLAFIFRFGECYPALMMPSFGGTGKDDDGRMRIRSVTINVEFLDGASQTPSTAYLLAEAPSSHRGEMMKCFLYSDITRQRLKEKSSDGYFARLLPGLQVRKERRGSSGLNPELKLWLRNRLQRMYPEAAIRSAEFTWNVEKFRFSGADAERESEKLGTLSVEF